MCRFQALRPPVRVHIWFQAAKKLSLSAFPPFSAGYDYFDFLRVGETLLARALKTTSGAFLFSTAARLTSMPVSSSSSNLSTPTIAFEILGSVLARSNSREFERPRSALKAQVESRAGKRGEGEGKGAKLGELGPWFRGGCERGHVHERMKRVGVVAGGMWVRLTPGSAVTRRARVMSQ